MLTYGVFAEAKLRQKRIGIILIRPRQHTKKAAPRRCLLCVLPLSEIAAVEIENERVQLLSQVDLMILDQLLDTCLLLRKARCVMQPMLNVEPGLW